MSAACVISCYNYARFVGDAVESALKQTTTLDEIVVVDDGSTDGSAQILRERFAGADRLRVIRKANEGQLSCFHVGLAETRSEVVFFLDADDAWEAEYVQEVLEAYREHPEVDCIYTGVRKFGDEDAVEWCEERDRQIGFSLLEAYHYKRWSGAPTSALSMKRGLLTRILPIPYLDDWRVRADDCLVFGASLAGACKRHLARPLVRYRVHEANRFQGRNDGDDAFERYRRRLALDRLFAHVLQRAGHDPEKLAPLAAEEFATIERPTSQQRRRYRRILLRSRTDFMRKYRGWKAMRRHYLAQHGAPRAAGR